MQNNHKVIILHANLTHNFSGGWPLLWSGNGSAAAEVLWSVACPGRDLVSCAFRVSGWNWIYEYSGCCL